MRDINTVLFTVDPICLLLKLSVNLRTDDRSRYMLIVLKIYLDIISFPQKLKSNENIKF